MLGETEDSFVFKHLCLLTQAKKRSLAKTQWLTIFTSSLSVVGYSEVTLFIIIVIKFELDFISTFSMNMILCLKSDLNIIEGFPRE